MTLLKTPTVKLDEDWTYCGEVIKAEKLSNGRRRIVGVASGIEEDRDGERVSARAIAKMVTEGQALIRHGNLKLTSSHQQDWASEFGDVVQLERDAETDQMLVACELPPEGQDALADKAWRAQTVEGKKLGFSIAGNLRGAFHEVDQDTGKRRKVLDDIGLRHMMLTEHPSYDRSFAIAVGKSFTGQPADDEFTEEVDLIADREEARAIVAKAAKTPPPGKDDTAEDEGDDAPTPAAPATPGDAPPGQDAPDAPEGDADAGKPSDEPSDAEMAAGLPMARHLSCPNCGHEFAAELPDDLQQDDGTADDDTDTDTSSTTKKTYTEPNEMSVTDKDLLAKIRELVEGSDVAKATQDPPPVAAAADGGDVMKSVQTIAAGLVASHEQTSTALDQLTADTKESFANVGKALTGIVEALQARPQGRKSVARVLPAATEERTAEAVGKTADDDDVAEAVAKSRNAQSAMGELNRRHPAYAHHYGT